MKKSFFACRCGRIKDIGNRQWVTHVKKRGYLGGFKRLPNSIIVSAENEMNSLSNASAIF